MNQMAPTPSVPDHVPAQLVREFRMEALPGVAQDAVQAAVDAARGMPDIFFGLGSRRGQGTWVLTRHELQREVLQDGATFSSRHNADFSMLIGEDWPLLPLEVDGADHLVWRKLLNPIFAPAQMMKLEAQIEELAADLVERLAPRGQADFMREFAEVFPVQIFLRMFGLPLEHTARFVEWEASLIHSPDIAGRQYGARAIVGYLREVIVARQAAPADDLISYIVQARADSRPLTPDEMLGICFLLYSAGLDTVANMLGYMFKYLAAHPEEQRRLRTDPVLIPNAVEEMLRAYPIIVSGRLVTRDIDFHGVTMKAGDVVTVATMFAGRDGQEFPDPDRIDFDREKVNHITFAAGPHRCIGSHLARRELRIALEAWLTRVPEFRIAEGKQAVTSAIGVFAVDSLPLAWGD